MCESWDGAKHHTRWVRVHDIKGITVAICAYASWSDVMGPYETAVSLDADIAWVLDDVADTLSDDGVDQIIAEYRAAINAALPEGLTLCGDTFYTDRGQDGRYSNFSIRYAVGAVDLWAIAAGRADAAR